MAGPIVYIDRSDIRPGTVEDLRRAVSGIVAFVEASEPQLIAYGFYVDEASSVMTVVAVHPDAASLEYHLTVGGPEFLKAGEFIRLRSIDVFGEVGDGVKDQLREKARMLGDATVSVHSASAGFARAVAPIGSPRP